MKKILILLILAMSVLVLVDVVSAYTNVSECGTISSAGEYRLNQSLSSNGTCFTIGASDVLFDGQGYEVFGDGTQYGVDISESNVTLVSFTFNNFDYGLRSSSENNTIEDSFFRDSNRGITSSGDYITIYNNSFNNLSFAGISLNSDYANIDSNNLLNLTQGSLTVTSSYSNITNNVIQNVGTSVTGVNGIYVTGSNNLIFNNLISNISGIGVLLSSGESNNVSSNDIINASIGSGITNGAIEVRSNNNFISDNNLLGDSVYSKKLSLTSTNGTFLIDQSNVLFGFSNSKFIIKDSSFGSVEFLDIIVTAHSMASLKNLSSYVSVQNNSIYVNTSLSSWFNKNASLELYNINTTNLGILNPQPYVDGSLCTDCSEMSVDGTTYSFNVTHFSNYSIWGDEVITDCTSLNETGETYYLGSNISATGTCITIANGTTALDCQGYSIIGDGSPGSGIHIDRVDNIEIRNCFVSNFSYGLLLENSDSSVFINNSVFNNSGSGFGVVNGSNNNYFNNNNVYLNTLSGFYNVGNENNFTNNNVYNNSIGFNVGGNPSYFTNNTLYNNSLFALNLFGDSITHLIDQVIGSYNISNTANLTIKDSTYGQVQFLNATEGNGTNLTNEILIENNSIIINSSATPWFNVSANLTFYNIVLDDLFTYGITDPMPFMNGAECDSSVCGNLTNTTTSFWFTVEHFTNFSIYGTEGTAPDTGSSSGSGSSSSGGSSGGGGGSSGSTYIVDADELEEGYTKEMEADDRFKVTFDGETYYLTVTGVDEDSVELNWSEDLGSDDVDLEDTIKFDLDDDDYYDFSITFDSVNTTSEEATLTIYGVSEFYGDMVDDEESSSSSTGTEDDSSSSTTTSTTEESSSTTTTSINSNSTSEGGLGELSSSFSWMWFGIVVLAILLVAGIVYYFLGYRGKKDGF